MGLKRKDLLSLTDLSADDITLILETADSFKEVSGREIKKVPASSIFPPPPAAW